jgi:hypothetical protein
MTQGIGGYRDTSTDDLLSRAIDDAGDHDPSRIRAETGEPLHFDATDSLDAHRTAIKPTDGGTAKALGVIVPSKLGGGIAYEKGCAVLATQVFSALLRAGAGDAFEGLSAITSLGTLYNEAIERAHREGDTERALAASDVGVVGMTQALDLDPTFKADVARAHAGAGNAAAAVRVHIDGDPGVKAELQLRADRGFVAAGGYAKLAVHAMAPLYQQAASKLAAAKAATVDQAAQLRYDAQALIAQAAAAERRYLAPVMGKARDDAAFGIGVQYAVHMALRAKTSGRWSAFDAAFAKASANLRGVEPPAVRIGG